MKSLRRRAPYLAAAVVIALFVLSLVIFVNRYNTDDSDPSADGGRTGGATPGSSGSAPGSPSPSPSATGARADGAVTGLPSTLPRRTVTAGQPGGFDYVDAPTHKVVLRVTAPDASPILGYLVPTSPDHSYGRVDKPGRSWSVTTTAYGKPYYAAIFVQAGSDEPVTCTIEIDGRVASTQATSGRFGRRLCVA